MLNPRNFTSLLVDKTIQAHEDDLINHSLLIYWEDSKTYKDNYSYSFHNIYIYIYIYLLISSVLFISIILSLFGSTCINLRCNFLFSYADADTAWGTNSNPRTISHKQNTRHHDGNE
jgi:hypothetical protein